MGEPGNDLFNDILICGVQNHETKFSKEVPYRTPDGSRVDLAVTTSFLRSAAGGRARDGIVVVFKDITESRSLERARQRVLDHLSHELKTPFSIIGASLRLPESSARPKVLERIGRNLHRIQEIQLEVEEIVRAQSARCRYAPAENEACPGAVAHCSHVADLQACARAGGTAFTLVFDCTDDTICA